MPFYYNQVSIIGVGLLGGSMGLALKKYELAGSVVGISRSETLKKAEARGAIDRGFGYDELREGIQGSDLIFLTAPVTVILDVMEKLSGIVEEGVSITDVGSTKAEILRAAERLFGGGKIFIGGHPMAGAEQAGVEKADAELYQGRPYILVPASNVPGAKTDKLEYAMKCIGAKTVRLGAEEHDLITASISHVPQLLSVALVNAIGRQDKGSGRYFGLAGGGLRDMTRIASSPFSIWEDICATNTGNIRAAIRALIAELQEIESMVDDPGLAEKFKSSAEFRKLITGISANTK